jgi:calcium/calmodulin-dependent protein kinase I
MSKFMNILKGKKKEAPAPPVTAATRAPTVYNGATLEDDFDVGKVLGSGQFGVVKTCVCKRTKKEFAVKELQRSLIYNASQQQAENELMKRMRHPSVVCLEQIYLSDTYMYIVMERAAGGDMLDRILNHPNGRLPERLARFFMWQVLCALLYLHKQQVAHRDLKPENVLLVSKDEFAQCKVCDFGYARFVGEQSFMESIVGTPAYWAPEVAKREEGYTMNVDMWSAGVLCYVALSGTFPYDEDKPFNPMALEPQYLYSTPCWSSISSQGKDWIKKMLTYNPVERFDTEQALSHPWLQEDAQLKKDVIALETGLGLPGSYNSDKLG